MPNELVKTKEEQEVFDAARVEWERRNRLEVEAMFAAEDDKRKQKEAEQQKRYAADQEMRKSEIAKILSSLSQESAIPPMVGPIVELLDNWRLAHDAEHRAIVQLEVAALSLDLDKVREVAAKISESQRLIANLRESVRTVLEGLK